MPLEINQVSTKKEKQNKTVCLSDLCLSRSYHSLSGTKKTLNVKVCKTINHWEEREVWSK